MPTSHVMLVSPPLFDARAPQLACPVLASRLKAAGHRVEVSDLNIRGINWLLEPAQLGKALAIAAGKREAWFDEALRDLEAGARPAASPGKNNYHRLGRAVSTIGCDDRLIALAGKALATLRDPALFYDPVAHHQARQLINAALNLHAFAVDDRLLASLIPQRYNSRYSVSSLSELLTATADGTPNLFAAFFKQVAVPEILARNPDFVGISISNVYQAIPGLTLARMLYDRGIYTVVGGTFYSKFRDELSRMPEFFKLCHLVVIGEGEEVLLQIAGTGPARLDPETLPNVLFRRGGQVVATAVSLQEEVPEPGAADFDSLDLKAYHTPEPVLPVYLGKGCAWGKCTFCEIPQINRDFGKWRRVRALDRVVDEIRVQHSRYGVRHFIFTDEDIEAKRLGQLADEIIRIGIDVRFMCYTRFTRHHSHELFCKLARAGCRKLMFGLESGSQKVNDACQKGVDLLQVPGIIDNCQRAGIAVHVFSIAGLPEEGEKEAEESEAYIRRLIHRIDLPTSSFDVSPFYLNWNAALRRNAEAMGVEYQNSFDFPINFKDYTLRNGVTHQEAAARARRMYQTVCLERSPLGLDVNYANSLFPMWEEITLLYLSKYEGRHQELIQWPGTFAEAMQLVVSVPEGLRTAVVPFRFVAGDRVVPGKTTFLVSPSTTPYPLPAELAGGAGGPKGRRGQRGLEGSGELRGPWSRGGPGGLADILLKLTPCRIGTLLAEIQPLFRGEADGDELAFAHLIQLIRNGVLIAEHARP